MLKTVLQLLWRTAKNAVLDVCYGVDTAHAIRHGVAPRPLPARMVRASRW